MTLLSSILLSSPHLFLNLSAVISVVEEGGGGRRGETLPDITLESSGTLGTAELGSNPASDWGPTQALNWGPRGL